MSSSDPFISSESEMSSTCNAMRAARYTVRTANLRDQIRANLVDSMDSLLLMHLGKQRNHHLDRG